MKRSVFLIAVALMSWVPLRAQGVAVSMPDTTITRQGVIMIPVTLGGVSPGSIYAYQLRVQFNSWILALDTVILSGTSTAAAGFTLAFSRPTPDEVAIAAGGANSLGGDGVLLYLRFRVLRAGGTSFTFTPVEKNFFNEGDPSVVFTNGSVWLNDPPMIGMYADREPIFVGETVQMNAWGGETPYIWGVTNPAVASISTDGMLTGTARGETYVVASDAGGLTDTIDTPVRVRAFGLTAIDTSFYASSSMNIRVHTSDLTGWNVLSGKVTFRFPEYYARVSQVRPAGGLLASGALLSWNRRGEGVVDVSFASSVAIQGEGPLFIIECSAVDEHYGGWTFEVADASFNENLPGAVRNGYIEISDPNVSTLDPFTLESAVSEVTEFSFYAGTPPLTWWVTDSTVGRIDASGRFTGLKRGTTRVRARDAAGMVAVSEDIVVYDARISIPDTSVRIGSTVNLPVYLRPSSTSPAIVSLQGTVQFDESMFRFVGIGSDQTLTQGWSFAASAVGPEVRIAGAGPLGLAPSAAPILLMLQFEVPAEVTVYTGSTMRVSSMMFNEGIPTVLSTGGWMSALTNIPPTPPQQASPADGDTIDVDITGQPDIRFRWYPSIDPDGDALLYTLTLSGPGIDTVASDLSDTTVVLGIVSQLYAGSAYSWIVSVTDGIDVVSAEGSYSFVTSERTNLPPTPPQLAIPADGDTIVLGTSGTSFINFVWHASHDPESDFLLYSLAFRGPGIDTTVADIADTTLVLDIVPRLQGNAVYRWWVSVSDGIHMISSADSFRVITSPLVLVGEVDELPAGYVLEQNYPNPFNPATEIRYTVAAPIGVEGRVRLSVLDLLGREVAVLVDDARPAGTYTVTWDATDRAAGIYVYRLQAGTFVGVRKMVLLK